MDSGFSWVVLACCFLSLFFHNIISSSAGMLQVEIMRDLQVGSGVVSMLPAFANGLGTLLGPLSGVLSIFLSLRYAVFLGITLMSAGMLVASFCQSIEGMMLFYGIVTGIGSGIAYCPCIVIISMYFEKRLILANGIIFCAPGLGLLSLPYLIRYVIDNYGWRYCMAMNAGILLQILVCASFFVPTDTELRRMAKIPWCCFRTGDASLNGSDVADDESLDNNLDDQTEANDSNIPFQDVVVESVDGFHKLDADSVIKNKQLESLLKTGSFGDTQSLSSGRNISHLSHTSFDNTSVRKPYIPVYINGTPEAARGFLRSPVTDLIRSESRLNGYSQSAEDVHLESGLGKAHLGNSLMSQFSSHYSVTANTTSMDNHHNLTVEHLSPGTSRSRRRFGQLRKERSLLGSSFAFASSEFGSSLMLPIKIEAIATSPVDEEDGENVGLRATLSRLKRNKALWLISIHCFFFMSACGVHGIHFPSFVASKGVPSHYVSIFYTVFGVSLLSGRLFGAIVYNRVMPPLLLLLFILEILNGLVLGLSPFYATNPTGIFILEGSLALVYGQSYMLQAPLVAQYVLVQDLPIAFGFTQLFTGIGYVVAPILAGVVFDATQTYNLPMHMAGSGVIVGAFILLAVGLFDKVETPGQQDSTSESQQEEKVETEEKEEKDVAEDIEENEKANAKAVAGDGGDDDGPKGPPVERGGGEVKTSKTMIREVGKV